MKLTEEEVINRFTKKKLKLLSQYKNTSTRVDVDNGITLCAGKGSCHNEFHKKYGQKNNTKEQFLQFKSDNK